MAGRDPWVGNVEQRQLLFNIDGTGLLQILGQR